MEQMIQILFVCIAMPMIPMLLILPDKRSRLILGYMITGAVICLVAGQINTLLLHAFGNDMDYVTTTITPISEELLKAIPILYFALIFSDDRDTLLSISFALGIGFAVLENATILTQYIKSVTISWALARVIGAALMHGACTACVGMGMSYIRKRRKLFYSGTFALLITAIIFHATFNVLVQSEYRAAALILPSMVYIPVVIMTMIRNRKNSTDVHTEEQDI
ncbi:MAG: PrsW family intramembrane metalloprotease [Oscillospiraceae bacterium]|nr:PrsW family intramembrane metalloprotease [Oscillospiraceae bacterium]MCR5806384.1 PrsW family intramembrane metalloprotease [Oscillospiraceae bacterium]